MKKKALKCFLIAAVIMLSSVDVGFAGDSYTIQVSCTIPAIPGLNVPLEDKTLMPVNKEAEKIMAQQETKVLAQEKENVQPAFIQEEQEGMQTVYSR